MPAQQNIFLLIHMHLLLHETGMRKIPTIYEQDKLVIETDKKFYFSMRENFLPFDSELSDTFVSGPV